MFEVRPVQSAELDALDSALWHWPGLHRSRLESQNRGDGVYLVAWSEGVPVGHLFVVWSGSPSLPEGIPSCADASDLFVHPDLRCKGVATALLECGERYAQSAACRYLGMSVRLHDAECWRFYHHRGYHPAALVPFLSEGSFLDDEGVEHNWADMVRYFTKELARPHAYAA